MENNDGKMSPIGRRLALQYIGASGLVMIVGCNKGKDQGGGTGPAGSCEDKVAIDDNARQLRRALQYKDRTDNPEKRCSTCAQFEAGKFGDCGGCKLFAGAVHPDGVCLSYAPKAPAAAPGAAPGAPPPKAG